MNQDATRLVPTDHEARERTYLAPKLARPASGNAVFRQRRTKVQRHQAAHSLLDGSLFRTVLNS